MGPYPANFFAINKVSLANVTVFWKYIGMDKAEEKIQLTGLIADGVQPADGMPGIVLMSRGRHDVKYHHDEAVGKLERRLYDAKRTIEHLRRDRMALVREFDHYKYMEPGLQHDIDLLQSMPCMRLHRAISALVDSVYRWFRWFR